MRKTIIALVISASLALGGAITFRAHERTVDEDLALRAKVVQMQDAPPQNKRVVVQQKKLVPAREHVRAKPHEKRSTAPVRERKVRVPRNPGGDKLPVSCATIRAYSKLPQGVLDQMESQFKPTPGQRAAAKACLQEG